MCTLLTGTDCRVFCGHEVGYFGRTSLLQARKNLRHQICFLSKQIAVYRYLTPCSFVNMHSSTDLHDVRTHQTAIFSQRRNNFQSLSLTRTHACTPSLLRKLQSTTFCCRSQSGQFSSQYWHRPMWATCFFWCRIHLSFRLMGGSAGKVDDVTA